MHNADREIVTEFCVTFAAAIGKARLFFLSDCRLEECAGAKRRDAGWAIFHWFVRFEVTACASSMRAGIECAKPGKSDFATCREFLPDAC